MKLNTVRSVLAAAIVMASASTLLANAYPDCQGWKPPAELKGKKAVETSFVGPSGGAVIIVHIGSKIACESAEQGVPSSERRQAEQKITNGKKLKIHQPKIEDFNVGYAGMGDCEDLYYDCYDDSSPNYGNPQPCAESRRDAAKGCGGRGPILPSRVGYRDNQKSEAAERERGRK